MPGLAARESDPNREIAMERRTRTVLIALAALAPACSGPADRPAPAATDAAVERVVTGLRSGVAVEGRAPATYVLADRMAFHNVPGVSVAVVDGGRILWARGFGVRDASTGEPVTPSTLFQAASISKPVAATGMLRLVEEGLLDLDAPVNTYLESWKVADNAFTATEPVTLRRIVSHNAGLTVHGFPGYAVGEDVPTVPQILDGEKPANTAAVRADTFPGAISRYSGGGITVEQLVMADVAGEPFPALMKRLVLDPLGMTRSTYEQPLSDEWRGEEAAAYRADGTMVEGRWHTYPEMAAAGLWTTPTDLLKWAMGITAARDGAEGAVLSQATATEMLTEQVGSYGLGPGLGGEGRGFHFGHGGANEGFRCRVIYFPETGQGAAIMTNGDRGGSIMEELLLSLAVEYGWPGYGPREIVALALDSTALQPYVGEYGADQPPVTVSITREGATLFADSPGNMPREEIVFDEGHRAISLQSATRFSFMAGPDGSIPSVEVEGFTLTRR